MGIHGIHHHFAPPFLGVHILGSLFSIHLLVAGLSQNSSTWLFLSTQECAFHGATAFESESRSRSQVGFLPVGTDEMKVKNPPNGEGFFVMDTFGPRFQPPIYGL